MARAAVLGRLTWLAGQLAAVREETATARTLVLDVPGWAGHLPGQHGGSHRRLCRPLVQMHRIRQ